MVPYNPTDTVQQAFLAALRKGESGVSGDHTWLGVGGADLSKCPRTADGFPLWAGWGHPISHAAGTYQFQPGTWHPYALKYKLNFAQFRDQEAAAWYLAQDVCAAHHLNLWQCLTSGNFSPLQSALARTWTSVVGTKATRGLAVELRERLPAKK